MFDTKLGWSLVRAATSPDDREIHFAAVESWPDEVNGFEDLVFLFNMTGVTKGLLAQNVDEAAHLYRVVHSLPPATIVEIGRHKGGSTFLIAAAMARGSTLYSVDLHLDVPPGLTGERLDQMALESLRRYGLDEGVNLVVGDSATLPQPPGPYDLVFIDADHSYEGGRRDYERWGRLVRPGGHLLMHDAAQAGVYPTSLEFPGLQRLAAEIADEGLFRRERGAGTLVHFVRV